MNIVTLKAQKREVSGRKVSNLRSEGYVPAVAYGHGYDNHNLMVRAIEFQKVLDVAGESTIIDVDTGSGKPIKVIIQDIQRDPVSDRIVHVDLRQVKLDEKITAEIELVFNGVPPAVKELGGIFVNMISAIEVKSLPLDLVHEINVDISSLATFDDKIYVKDLVVPSTLEVLTDPTVLVATVEQPRAEEEITPSTEEAEKAALSALDAADEAKKAEKEKAKEEAGSGDKK